MASFQYECILKKKTYEVLPWLLTLVFTLLLTKNDILNYPQPNEPHYFHP